MLYIWMEKHGAISRELQWHVGEALPKELFSQRVVKFQADGDELDLILAALTGVDAKTQKG